MNESYNVEFDSRVEFSPGEQKKFLKVAFIKTNSSWSFFAQRIGVNQRTLNDWRREKYSMPFKVLQLICKLTKIKRPTNIIIKKPFWYTKMAGKIGGSVLYKKYGSIGGSSTYRKQKWREWWKYKGQFNKNNYFIQKDINKPQKNNELAEFVGIMMGDGGITNRQITITLNSKTDKHYGSFIRKSLKKLFSITPSIYIRKKEKKMNIVVSRTKLVEFCLTIGLKKGDKLKQGLDIPNWIKNNKTFSIYCLRGLMDTDGCIFGEHHYLKNKKYSYPRLAFVSYSENLRLSVYEILKNLGFSPKIRNNRNVQLENRQDIVKYFKIVNTNNNKHKKRLEIVLGGLR